MPRLRRLAPHGSFVAFTPVFHRAPRLRSRQAATRRLARPGAFLRRVPVPALVGGEIETSQVPGEPLRTCPALRPRRTGRPSPKRDVRCSLPHRKQRRLRGHFLSRLYHAACSVPVYASQPGSLLDHATLGSGWWLTVARTGLAPAGFLKEVSVTHIGYMTSPPSRLFLAQFHRKRRSASRAMPPRW
jgi:hypothetical protein